MLILKKIDLISDIGKVLSSKTRILILIKCSKSEHSIKQLSEDLLLNQADISYQIFYLIKYKMINYRREQLQHGKMKFCKTSSFGKKVLKIFKKGIN